ncbi:MAG: pyridoxamine 5'-phosphate oxidase family protein [Acidobacteria bacterium]|nr:pyridoxamine 5'-phosphate oxidase family protein [Acidobacteriota bacterium]
MLRKTNNNRPPHNNEIGLKISTFLAEIDVCLIWSRGLAADLHRRPMTQNGGVENGLWFFIPADFHLIDFYRDSPAVTVAASNPTTKKCAALAGRSSIITAKQSIAQFMADKNATTVQSGIQAGALVLLKIEIDQMDFWEWPDGTLVHSTCKLENPRVRTDQKWTLDGPRSSYCQ